jgi:hypothetical protein
MHSGIFDLTWFLPADEYGITAEDVKFAGSEIYTLYQDVFNQIFQEGKVAQSFKTGVITPILTKSKNQMLTENYLVVDNVKCFLAI